MIGLELTIKGKTVAVAVERGVASIIVTQIRNASVDSIHVDFSGLRSGDDGADEYPKWLDTTDLRVGDELVIRVKEIDQISPAIRVNKE